MRRENSVRYSNCTLEEADLCAANLGSKHLNDARPHATSFLTRILLVSHEQRGFRRASRDRRFLESSAFLLDSIWMDFGRMYVHMERSMYYIYLLINLRICKNSQNNYCTCLSNIIMYRRLLIVIELDKNVNMYSIICDLM